MGRRVVLIVSVVLLASVTSFLSAGGQQEDPIRRARELVAENRIDEAILVLESVVREDPERIREAEALMSTIREIRGEYNVLFEQLIDNLVNNPDDIERTLAIIDQMEALDEFPNARVVSQIEDARTVAQLAFDRNQVEAGMERALELLEEERYREAIDVYLSLQDFQRPQFDARGYGQIFVASVDGAVASLESAATALDGRLAALEAAVATALAAPSTDEISPVAQEATLEAAASAWELVANAERLGNDVAVLKSQVGLQFPDLPVDWYLNFQEIILRGRAQLRGEEGIAYAIARAYDRPLVALDQAAATDAQEAWERGIELSNATRHEEAEVEYRVVERASGVWRAVASARQGLFAADNDVGAAVAAIGPASSRDVVVAAALERAAASRSALSDQLVPFVDLTGERADTLFVLQSRRDAAASIFNALDAGLESWIESRSDITELPPAALPGDATGIIDLTTDAWEEARIGVIDVEREVTSRIAELRVEGLPEALDRTEATVAEARPLLEGAEQVVSLESGEETTRVSRFPDRAAALVNDALSVVDGTIETTTLTLDDITDEPPRVADGAAVVAARSAVASIDERARALRATLVDLQTDAQQLIAEALELRQEGLARAADTRAAIAATQAQAARANFEATREALFASLELREEVAFREDVDELIRQLGEELQELENVIVVRRVRELITQADDLYRQDEFAGARDTLVEAQQTWFQTNVETNPEIERLLQLVTAALTLEEGRELTITDPLYPILSNYLSVARDDFNRGVALLDDEQPARADVFFDRSIENLRNVRQVRPLNWEARLLELRIAQIRTPDEFDQIFETRYQQALDRLDEVGPLQVYSEIEVLAEINPDYPGIQEQIRRLEIALNLRPVPVDLTQTNRAAELFSRAQQLSAAGSTDQVAVAVSLLEQAIELNPTNRDAAFLLDQLRIQLGGQATVSLSTTDEQQYRRAETLFSQGQVLQALAIVERLLAVADNQSYPPLVELRRRIGLRLGI